jgi:hypothetical protein
MTTQKMSDAVLIKVATRELPDHPESPISKMTLAWGGGSYGDGNRL